MALSMTEQEGVRLDKWLWAARFFKTRRLAVDAIDGGKVHVNGGRAKAAKEVRPGFEISVRKGPYEFDVVVTGLAERRGSAKAAALLYEETAESLQRRERLREQIAASPPPLTPDSRPDKKDRRRLASFKRGG
jgi:ribosome-associated heat shock protein Hsp15